jgi:SNF2 family DNA or RNA helicase
MAEMDIVLTTYSLISPDFAEFDSIEWDLLCIDEAQNIKNPNVKQSKAVRRLRSTHRIAMTGTPIENNLNELWSIYDFINPNYLGTLPFFRTQYVSHSDKNAQDEVRSRLRAIIYPFLLRRVKKDPQVMLALPEKHEVKVFVQLTAEQTVLYENEREQLLEQSSSGQKQLQMGAVLKAITRYKQICNHPLLIERPQMLGRESVAEQSNKLLRLLEMIEEIHERGERALVFTQYVEMGKIIVRELKRRFLARDILFFDGSATGKQRQQMISDFQKQDSHIPVMVLTIRSGGVGINLTAANHVFHYDRWWNPAVENQATDRTYRIGQTKDVTVYKLITVGTIEEKIDSLLSEKKELSDFMLLNDDDDIMRKLTVTDWERLLL